VRPSVSPALEVLSPTVRSVLARAGDPGYDKWAAQLKHAGYCRRPVRLVGSSVTLDEATGVVRSSFDTATEPDGMLLKACRNRRTTVCPTCAETYRADSYQLVAAGLAGGKTVPDTVAAHPRLFVTLTAPSFGPVHSRRETDSGQVRPCRPARGHCPHGVRRGCNRRHPAGEELLGQPICPDCFDYAGAVLWQAQTRELWRRTTIAIVRQLARQVGRPVRQVLTEVRLSYTKVVEYQTRGLVHFHAVVRLDAKPPADDPLLVLPPPAGYSETMLAEAVTTAVSMTTAPALTDDPGLPGTISWGSQVDVRTVPTRSCADGGPRQVAAYIAKYATKSTDEAGALDHRIRERDQIDTLAVNDHLRRLVATAWHLGRQPHLAGLRLRAWAHTLGYRGHWATRSRRYSTTLKALRLARQDWHHGAAAPPTGNVIPLARAGQWRFAGSGYRSSGDEWLASSAAASYEAQRAAAQLDARTRIAS